MTSPGVVAASSWPLKLLPTVVPVVKNALAHAGDLKRHAFDPWVGKIPWRRAWKPTPLFLPGESHGQRSLVSMGVAKSRTWLSDYTFTFKGISQCCSLLL